VRDAARKEATYDELCGVPDHLMAQIVDGVLYTNPRPAKGHSNVASVLGEELGPPFRRARGGPGGWILLDEPELHLAPDILVPDLAGWRRERMPPMGATEAYFDLAPDWICEVLSPSTSALDRKRKLPIYARERVGHAWIIDPLACTLEVLRREGAQWLLLATYADADKVRAEPFDAFKLDLSFLWADVVR